MDDVLAASSSPLSHSFYTFENERALFSDALSLSLPLLAFLSEAHLYY